MSWILSIRILKYTTAVRMISNMMVYFVSVEKPTLMMRSRYGKDKHDERKGHWCGCGGEDGMEEVGMEYEYGYGEVRHGMG